jgi:hypothetical protein
MPSTDDLDRLKDFDEIAQLDQRRGDLAEELEKRKNEAVNVVEDDGDTDTEPTTKYPEGWYEVFGSYDHLKRGPAWEAYKKEQEEAAQKGQEVATPACHAVAAPSKKLAGYNPSVPVGIRKPRKKSTAVYSKLGPLKNALTGAIQKELEEPLDTPARYKGAALRQSNLFLTKEESRRKILCVCYRWLDDADFDPVIVHCAGSNCLHYYGMHSRCAKLSKVPGWGGMISTLYYICMSNAYWCRIDNGYCQDCAFKRRGRDPANAVDYWGFPMS